MDICITATMTISITACSEKESEQNTESDAVSSGTTVAESTDELEVTNDYAMDLTPLGMPLTVYLRLEEDGKFILSNALDFATDKGSGTFQKSGEEYIMVYSFLNGEEKSVSDGITASFVVTEDGSLDFSGCASVPYGSAKIDTVSKSDTSVKLIAHVVEDDAIHYCFTMLLPCSLNFIIAFIMLLTLMILIATCKIMMWVNWDE